MVMVVVVVVTVVVMVVGVQAGKSPRGIAPATKCSAPATKSALQGHKVPRLSTAPATKSALQGPQSTAPVTTSENEPHVQKSRFTSRVTKSEHVEDYQCCACHEIYRNLHIEVKPLRPLAPVTMKVDFGPPKHEVSLAPATKSDHQSACGTATRAHAQSKCTSRISRGMNVL